MNHRRTSRFALHVPVFFTWQNEYGMRHRGKGHTRDMSANGAFVSAPFCPPKGATVGLAFSLPRLPNAGRALWLQANGRVVRVEPRGRHKGRGFAIANDRVALREKIAPVVDMRFAEAQQHPERAIAGKRR